MPAYIAGLGRDENTDKIGVLLANLGTPEAPTKGAVRRYLKEFLWDPRIVEVPRFIWWFALNGIILNIRPSKSARAYSKVWTEHGSPLLLISRKQQKSLQQRLDKHYPGRFVVELGMRYGHPSINTALEKLAHANARKLVVLPLYPQYSATTTASITDGMFDVFKRWRVIPELRVATEYHVDNHYIQALADSVSRYWQAHGKGDKLLFSFHSIPKRYADHGDIYPQHCKATVQALVTRLGLRDDEWALSYQSRLGREEWLRPYTDETVESLAAQGVKRLDVVCPGFSADCLETLEEIDQENRDFFLSKGGSEFHYIPALNDDDAHIDMMEHLVLAQAGNWLE
ncbi:MAG: ferrochelatase [Gammaproteobacteria bacterium]|nr:ferrochelatase [Gammaproteobacteria bacterium]